MSVDDTSGTTLSDFDSDEDERPNWTPLDDETERVNSITCQKCGAENNPDVGRVIGNNDDELENGCFKCSTGRELMGIEERYGSGVGGSRL